VSAAIASDGHRDLMLMQRRPAVAVAKERRTALRGSARGFRQALRSRSRQRPDTGYALASAVGAYVRRIADRQHTLQPDHTAGALHSNSNRQSGGVHVDTHKIREKRMGKTAARGIRQHTVGITAQPIYGKGWPPAHKSADKGRNKHGNINAARRKQPQGREQH